MTFAEGDVFSQTQLTTTNNIITERLGNEGYTFAEVRGFPEVNEADKTAKITFFINPGQRAYVRRIEFRGNTKTADEVLRREMRQMEGASASGQQIEQSKIRLERLGFFREVEVETVEVPGTNDQVDVVYTVEEQPSGSIGQCWLPWLAWYSAPTAGNNFLVPASRWYQSQPQCVPHQHRVFLRRPISPATA